MWLCLKTASASNRLLVFVCFFPEPYQSPLGMSRGFKRKDDLKKGIKCSLSGNCFCSVPYKNWPLLCNGELKPSNSKRCTCAELWICRWVGSSSGLSRCRVHLSLRSAVVLLILDLILQLWTLLQAKDAAMREDRWKWPFKLLLILEFTSSVEVSPQHGVWKSIVEGQRYSKYHLVVFSEHSESLVENQLQSLDWQILTADVRPWESALFGGGWAAEAWGGPFQFIPRRNLELHELFFCWKYFTWHCFVSLLPLPLMLYFCQNPFKKSFQQRGSSKKLTV